MPVAGGSLLDMDGDAVSLEGPAFSVFCSKGGGTSVAAGTNGSDSVAFVHFHIFSLVTFDLNLFFFFVIRIYYIILNETTAERSLTHS